MTIDNQTPFALHLGKVEPLEHGKYEKFPDESVAKGQTVEVWYARSPTDSMMGIKGGSVTYGLPDGSKLHVQFDMPYAVLQTTWATAEVDSVGGTYGVNVTCTMEKKRASMERTFKATVTVNTTGDGTPRCWKTI
jgi:hypothetical protein